MHISHLNKRLSFLVAMCSVCIKNIRPARYKSFTSVAYVKQTHMSCERAHVIAINATSVTCKDLRRLSITAVG